MNERGMSLELVKDDTGLAKFHRLVGLQSNRYAVSLVALYVVHAQSWRGSRLGAGCDL